MLDTPEVTSTRPYLIRALYEWCTDNGFTPHVAVSVDETVCVPRDFVRGGEIVLNISFDATSALHLSNDTIEFKARFAGVPRDIVVPMDRVMAIYARENGQGMAFPMVATTNQAGSTTPSLQSTGRIKRKALASVPTTDKTADKSVDTASKKIVSLSEHKANLEQQGEEAKTEDAHDDGEPPRPPNGRKPALKRVK